MALRMYHIVIDAHDPRSLARFWAEVLDDDILFEDDDEAIFGSDVHVYPGLYFLRDPDRRKRTSNLLLASLHK